MALHTLEICAGGGMLGEGLRAGLKYLGHETRTVCYIEREAYVSAVLVSRIEEGSLDDAPIWSDLLTFAGEPWRGKVDCIVAGFPCQDLSLAGKRAGLDGARSGLFFNIVDIADDCSARFLFLENVAGITSATASVVDSTEGELDERAASRVLGELADRGWCAEWLTLSASEVGASHGRARWFCWAWRVVADTESIGFRSRRAKYAGQQRGFDATEPSAPLDNAGRVQRCAGHEQHRPGVAETGGHQAHHGATGRSGDVANPEGQRRGKWERTEWAGRAEVKGAGDSMAYTGGERSEAWISGQNKGQKRDAGIAIDDSSIGLFAPGPGNTRWGRIIADNPHLAPALESSFRGVVNGLAFGMDDSRPQRLRCVGNGVVAAQAALAACVLIGRAGFTSITATKQ